jgi:hypothetical protein
MARNDLRLRICLPRKPVEFIGSPYDLTIGIGLGKTPVDGFLNMKTMGRAHNGGSIILEPH